MSTLCFHLRSSRVYLRGAYTRSKACVKEMVGVSGGRWLIHEGGLIGGEMQCEDSTSTRFK